MNRKQTTILLASLAIVFVASIMVFSGSPTGHTTYIDMFQEPEVLEFKGRGGELVVELEFPSKDVEIESADLTVSGDYSDWITEEISDYGGVRVSIANGNPYPVVLHADRRGKIYVTWNNNGKWITDIINDLLPGMPIVRTLASATTQEDKLYHITYIDTKGTLRHVINTKIASSGGYSGGGWENTQIIEPTQVANEDRAFTYVTKGAGNSLHLVYGYGIGGAMYKKRANGEWGNAETVRPGDNMGRNPTACDGSVIENIKGNAFMLTWYCELNRITLAENKGAGWRRLISGASGSPSELSLDNANNPRFYNTHNGKLWQMYGVTSKLGGYTPQTVDTIAAPAHEIALGGYSFVIVNRGGAQSGVVAYERVGIPRKWLQTPTFISGATPFDIASMVGEDKSVYAAFESRTGMTLAYKTPPPISPTIYVQNDNKLPVWDAQGWFASSVAVDSTKFKDALQSYINTQCKESPCTVPITVSSQSAGKLILSDLQVGYSAKVSPQHAPVLESVEGPDPAKEGKLEQIEIFASDEDSEAFKVFICKTDKFSTQVKPGGPSKIKLKYTNIEGCLGGELCKSMVVFKKNAKAWESMQCKITPSAASQQVDYHIYLMDAEGNLAGPFSGAIPINRRPSATKVEVVDAATQMVAPNVRKGDVVECTYAFSDPDINDKKDERATQLEWWTPKKGVKPEVKRKVEGAETQTIDISKVSELKKGVKFGCGVKVADNRGHAASDFASSKSVTILDTRPTRPETSVAETVALPSEKITATCVGSTDIDGDEVTYLYAFCKREEPWPEQKGEEFPGGDVDRNPAVGRATMLTESDESVVGAEDVPGDAKPVHPLPQDCNAVRGWDQDNTYAPTNDDVDKYIYAVGMAVADGVGSEPTNSDTVEIAAAPVEPDTPSGSGRSRGSSADPEEEELLAKKTCTNQGYLCASKCAPDTSVSMHDATCAGKVCCKAAATADLRQGPIEEKETNWLVIGLIAGIVLVAAGIGFGIWYYLKKRKQVY